MKISRDRILTTHVGSLLRLVAQRICHFADIVGRERVIAGTDCGISTFAGLPRVHPTITWVKFQALAEGARQASVRLWN